MKNKTLTKGKRKFGKHIIDSRYFTVNVSDDSRFTINITDCKKFTVNVADCKGFAVNISDAQDYQINKQNDAIVRLEENQKSEGWIPCKECMPEEGVVVLVNVCETGRDEAVLVGCCSNGVWLIRKGMGIFEQLELFCVVTAWQMLPRRYGVILAEGK